MTDLLGIDNAYAETMQGQRYFAGQQFKPHHDFFHPDTDYWQRERLAGGQRSWTAMIFLDQPEAGGNTEFPELGIGVRPEAGRMLLWNNCNPDGSLNHKTLHTGTFKAPCVVGYIQTADKALAFNEELRLHRLFKDERVRGEWFRLTEAVVDEIKRRGTLDYNALLV